MPVEWALQPAAAFGRAASWPLPDVTYTRLYWGDGFCHRLLPTRAERREAQEAGLALTLATPPVSEPELGELRQVLDWLEPGEEVEVNDFGVLRLVAREFPHLRPVLGRALWRSLKDPRRLRAEAAQGLGGALAEIVRQHGVRMVTADGLALPGAFDLAVVVGHRFVSSGRVCLIAATGQEAPQRFSIAAPCRRECRDLSVSLEAPSANLLQKGNTVFAPWSESDWAELDEAIAGGQVARVVVPGEPT